FFRFDPIERDRAYFHLLAVRWPTDAGVVRRIAGLSNDDDQSPTERLLTYLRDEVMEQVILVRWGGTSRLERLHRFHHPAHWRCLAPRIRETERMQGEKCRVTKSRSARLVEDHLEHRDRFRMALFKRLDRCGIGLPGRWVQFECEQALKKDLGCAD